MFLSPNQYLPTKVFPTPTAVPSLCMGEALWREMFGCAFKNLSLVILPALFLLVCLITAQKRELTCLMLKAIALIDWLLTEFLACQFIHYVHVCINFPALKSVTPKII